MSLLTVNQRYLEGLAAVRLAAPAKKSPANKTYVRDPSRLEPAGLRTKDQKQEWQVQLDRLMEDIRKGAAEYGPDTSVAYTCALNLKALTQDVQLILKAAAEDCSKTAAACSQPETTTVGSKVLAHCTDNLAVIVKAVNRHCSCNEQECHTKATSSAASKSMPASSQQQIGSAANSRKNELWWHDIRVEMALISLLLGRSEVTRDQVRDMLKPIVKGQYWLYDQHRAVWCRSDDSPVIADDLHLAEQIWQLAPVPIINLGATYTTDQDDLEEPLRRELLQLLKTLDVPCLSEVLQERPLPGSDAECKYEDGLINILMTCSRNWIPQHFSEGTASKIIEVLNQRVEQLKVRSMSRLTVQYQLQVPGAPEVGFNLGKFAHWHQDAAGASTLLLPSLSDVSQRYQLSDFVHATTAEMARIALQGSTGTAVDTMMMPALVARLQPLVWRMALRLQGLQSTMSHHQWQELWRAIRAAAEKVQPRIEGEYNSSLRQFFDEVLLLLSGSPGVASLIRSMAWKDLRGASAKQAFGDPDKMMQWLLLEAESCALLYDINTLVGCFPPCFYEGSLTDQAGKIGEIVVALALMFLLIELGFLVDYVEDMWPYGEHFDIRARAPGSKEVFHFEVKSTSYPVADAAAHEFKFSRLEYQAAQHYGAKYLLVRVYGVPVRHNNGVFTPADLKMLVLKGPFTQQDGDWIEIKDDVAQVDGVAVYHGDKLVNVGNGLGS